MIIWIHTSMGFFSILRQNDYYIIDKTVCKIPVYTCNIFTHMHRHYIALYYTKAFLVGIYLINTWNNLL